MLVVSSLCLVASALAAEPQPEGESTADSEATTENTQLDLRVDVVGEAREAARIPGSAHRLSAEALARHEASDIHRILRAVPGVNFQEEDGYGLRPNIGLRGTGVERSAKVTLLEDGVLIAPAPYSAPAAYYFPTAARMRAVEVRKGSAAIEQGPFTNGGAINLLSTAIPNAASGQVRLRAGSHDAYEAHLSYGRQAESFGFLVEGYRSGTDGFKTIDGLEGRSTGFDLEDYLGKARWTGAAEGPLAQQIELKASSTVQEGDETYLGLTEQDFRRTPYVRYLASAEDRIDTDHEQLQLRHHLRTGTTFDITTTVYRNDYFRNWHKNESTEGISNARILEDPQTYARQLSFLRGESDSPTDAFTLRNNRRRYRSEGAQTRLAWQWQVGSTAHQVEVGLRVHDDEEDRFQEDDRYAILGGTFTRTSTGAPGSQANRVSSASAHSLFLQDRILFGRFSLTPGVRIESIDTSRLDFASDDPNRTAIAGERSNSIDEVVPGIGLSFQATDRWILFSGIHRGFAPPSPSSREGVRAEESTNYEVGARRTVSGSSFDIVAFWSDYDNLLGTDTESGGGTGTGEQFNGGAARVRGLESSWTRAFEIGRGQLPVRAAYTFTSSEFSSSFTTSFADWAPAVQRGDEIPFLAEHQLFAEVGLQTGPWSLFLSANHTSDVRSQAGQGPIPAGELIEQRTVFDAAAHRTIGQRLRLSLQVQNLTDEVYVAARRPYGLRPGLDRTVRLGLRVNL